MHYSRWWKHGDPLHRGPKPRGSVRERFESKVDKSGGCWEWTASRNMHGYGQMLGADRRHQHAHRIAYELYKGPIPEGLDIDHLCRNRGCVNPAHLEPVTRRTNLRRGFAARFAEQGRDYTP